MVGNLEVLASRLGDETDYKTKLSVATDVRDGLDGYMTSSDYEPFLSKVLPTVLKLLESVPVSFTSNSPEQRLRACLLEILGRLQTNETLKPHAATILKLLMTLLRTENEENGVLCMKVLTALHRNYKQHLADQVQPFFDFVMELYKNMPKIVKDLFDSNSGGTPSVASFQSPKPLSPNDSEPSKPLPKALHSFKVLTECPIIIVLLYSTHKEIVPGSLPKFIPLIIEMLSLQAPPQARAHEAATAKGEIQTSVSPQIKNRAAYGEFITAQVKTMSFLAYALRGYVKYLNDYYEKIPSFVVRLLQDCPCELYAARKELLVATRHILSTEFRKHFVPKVDILLNERVLIGDGLTVHETLRPLAYSTMADLVHHVRADLTSAPIWKTVRVYCKNMQDNTLATNFQIMSAKLLLNLVERIMRLEDKAEGRQIMVLILNAFVERFAALNRSSNDELERAINVSEPINNELKDAQYIFKNLMQFLKTVMFGLKSCNPPPPSPDFTNWQESARMFNYEQITIFRQLFREGISGHLFFSNENEMAEDAARQTFDSGSSLMIPSSKEEKELMEAFATVFIHIDPASFSEVVRAELPFMYEAMFKNTALLHIPQFFLASEATSSNFLAILIEFLKEKLPELGDGAVKSNILIRLFKLSFMAVTLFPSANELVLLPHLRKLIVSCMELTTTAKEPLVYFNLLRTLFRSIGGGRFEQLYNEVLPLLQVLLESLNKLLATARRPQERNIYVELCLTVPVRLNVLVPHLSYLMRPLVYALNGTPELVSQGLRTLELCVDNLTAEYFDPIIEPVIGDVMAALWRHLRPLPYAHQHSHTTLRVLGKLGGRNRRFLSAPDNLRFTKDVTVDFSFYGADKNPVNIIPAIESALGVLDDPRVSVTYKTQAFHLLSRVLMMFIESDPVPDLGKKIRECGDGLTKEDWGTLPGDNMRPDNELVQKLLQSVFVAITIPGAQEFLKDICEHFTVLELGDYLLEKRQSMRQFEIDDHDGKSHCDPTTLVDAIVFAISHYDENIRQAGKDAIKYIYEAGRAMFEEMEAAKLPLFRFVYGRLSHACFEQEYYRKSGACVGLKVLSEIVPLTSLCPRRSEIVRTMLFVIKDVPNDVPSAVKDNAKELLFGVLEDYTHEDNQMTGLLTYELGNSNRAVRDVVKEALVKISETDGKPVAELMEPVKSVLLQPIFGKPLRALPFPMQIGHIDAIAWCLGLKNTFLEFNEEFNRLLLEALALVDAEDESLTSMPKHQEHRTTQHLIQLRVVCIQLLSLALAPENAVQQQTRPRIIAVFFKTLYSRYKEVVDAAHIGLGAVLSQNGKLPKDLLQNGLRPILMRLSDHKRLSIDGLEGLARLLELLTSYFKVEIGKKLVGHLQQWADEKYLHQISNRNIESQHNVKLMVAILEIFHLLPSAAHMYMDGLITELFKLEKHLRRTQNSPFRAPIAKFLNRYPQETFKYFLPKLSDRTYGRFFSSILPQCPQLRKYGRENFQQLKENIQGEPQEKCVSICNLISVMQALNEDGWIMGQKQFLDDLNLSSADMVQTSSACELTSPIPLQVDQALETLQQLYVDFFRQQQEIDMVFSIINVLCTNKIKISPHFHQYLKEDVVQSDNVQHRRQYLMKCIELTSKNMSLETRTFMFKYIVNPMLMVEGQRNGNLNQLLEKSTGTAKGNTWLDMVHSKVWRNSGGDILDENAGTIDHYRFELLQMSALLIKLGPQVVADARKDIIKFGWNFIKLEDIISKQSAYVLIAHFIHTYETFPKILVQIYVSLLRTYQNEARNLVKQSLDLIAPRLPKLLGSPLWAKWPRRVLSEDGHNIHQVIHVYQYITRHAELFFEYRDHFIPIIISALPKLTHGSQPDHQVLAVELAELILKWEKMTKENKTEKTENVGEMGEMQTIPHQVSFNHREACVTYLIRFVCVSQIKSSESALSKRVITVLSQLMSEEHWPDVEIKLSFFERTLIHSDFNNQNTLPLALNALEVIAITMERKSSSWVAENIHVLERLLEKCVKADNIELMTSMGKLLKVIFKSLRDEVDEEDVPDAIQTFIKMITDAIVEHLSNANTSQAYAGITMAESLLVYKDNALDNLFPSLMKCFGKLVRDHIGEDEDPRVVELIFQVLDFSSARISYLGDQRRVFMTLVAQLIEKSKDRSLCHKLVDLHRRWVFSKQDLFPTMKEKAGLLVKMLTFEHRADILGKDLLEKYYNVVVDIYADPDLARSDLSVRMEQPFLIGTRTEDPNTRQKLMSILSNSIDRNIVKRLTYVISDQNWEYLSEYFWLNQGVQLLYGSIDDTEHVLVNGCRFLSLSDITMALGDAMDVDADNEGLSGFVERRQLFVQKMSQLSAGDILQPLVELQYQDSELTHNMWVQIYPIARSAVPNRERTEMARSMVGMLTREYHNRQIEMRPNVVQSLVEGAGKSGEHVPPHLVKYCGKQFDAWYSAIQVLENIEANPVSESTKVAESNLDALVELYSGLQENDFFYGCWRRRAKYSETNSGLSYEQCGLWSRAMQMYEAAQIKARSGALPYSESEYCVWEDHWIMCAQKLQQWDVLTELAKHEGFTDLLLECGWRVADWTADKEPLEQSIKTVMDVPTPRRQVFETFLCLQGFANKAESMQELSRYCDEGIQLALRKWHSLPSTITNAHIPLLHTFQQYVEFMEASQVYTSLQATTVQNLDTKSQELKGVLQAWRERLPNIWDDINLWGDLVTWRQHAFNVINKTYLPLIPQLPQNGNNNSNSFAYRGYHEIAWIINRFAHVARKHNMPEVCINQLSKIYTLPNIEIQEAFLKLREQAKCHYQNPNEMNTGLDVISNTNLVYFASQQKAEFFTLKGMFLAKLGVNEDANNSFSAAVQIDLYLPKAWAEWGRYNDQRFKEHPDQVSFASNAISCYLQAAGLYKNGKTRKLLGRILWLMSLDDQTGTIQEAFESFKGDVPVWYWITFIPQLLTSLSHKEAPMARALLIKIAKTYPQALHFHLRTTKEDYTVLQRQAQQAAANAARSGNVNSPTPSTQTRQPWEHVEEIMSILKTAYPLLALSLETFVDQIYQRFKCSVDEDAYRLIVALLNDGVQYMGRLTIPKEDAKLPPATESNITRFAESVLPKHIKTAFEADFVTEKPNLENYILKLRKWRDRFEEKLDNRETKANLESLSPHLSEFHYQKFEDVEVPGQYLEHKDSNTHFIKIDRFASTVDLVRGFGVCNRRFTLIGHDGSEHAFSIQYPAARHCRREERVTQLFKILNGVISRKKESRSRNLQFTLPVAVPLSPHIRIVQDDSRYVSMHSIYEDYCRRHGQSRDAPLDFANEKLRASYDAKLPKPDLPAVKMEILNAVQASLVPTTVLRDYFTQSFKTFADFWLFRKQFSYQYAGVTFMTFLMCINNRYPHKYLINTGSGNVCPTEMLPSMLSDSDSSKTNRTVLPPSKSTPTFHNIEPVPFRLTPNIQALMGPTALEGLYSMSIMIIAQCLTEPEFDLDQYLYIFVRDELISWYTQQHRASVQDQQLREIVKTNVETIVKRASTLSQHGQGNIPSNQTVIDLISQAVNPRNMAVTDNLWMPYF